MSSDAPPPFLPLEESNDSERELLGSVRSSLNSTSSSTREHTTTSSNNNDLKRVKSHNNNNNNNTKPATAVTSSNLKRLLGLCIALLVVFLLHDAIFTPPDQRFIKPDASDRFLRWVQRHPLQGIVAFMLVIGGAVILLLPVGTPLTIGCGFVYKTAYGWKLGVLIATTVSMLGSAAGACACFLLGRYLLRDHVRTYVRKNPLLEAIDIAAAEHGLRILAMLYLTPIAPLGPLSYMSGTTSMALSHFALAKVASLPIMMLYVFIGASAGALVAQSSRDDGDHNLDENTQKLERDNPKLIICGIVVSVVMISSISVYIKKELFKILERQKKFKPHDSSLLDVEGQVGGEDKYDMEAVEPLMSRDHFTSSRETGLRGRIVSTDRREDLMEQRQEILTTVESK